MLAKKDTNVRVFNMQTVHATHIGTATVLLEIDGLRILTDPVLDPAGSQYRLGKTGLAAYTNLDGPALDSAALGRIDLGLVSHDQHKDNLDRAGRAALAGATNVLTTVSGARRLVHRFGLTASGLAPWDAVTLRTPSGRSLRVTATPAQHGPRWLRPLTGDVIGFVLEHAGWNGKAIYISGDTVMFGGLEAVAARFDIDLAFLHVGAGRFRATPGVRYSFDAAEAAQITRLLQPTHVVPIHFEGWSHFSEGRPALTAAFETQDLQTRLRWLAPGERSALRIDAGERVAA